MDRSCQEPLAKVLDQNRQILMVSGPRQVGKTTLAKSLLKYKSCSNNYLTWDDSAQRELILAGTPRIVSQLRLDQLSSRPPMVVFDELHKYQHWKNFLKGLFDQYELDVRFMVTGSARLNLFNKGGDSLMGRYFHYRLHPLSVAELTSGLVDEQLIQPPVDVDQQMYERLLQFGGFPEPFFKAEKRFSNRWQSSRMEQLLHEDIREGSKIHELKQLEVLASLLSMQASKETKYTSLAKAVRVSVDTIRRWLDVLETFYYCYRIRPWHSNLATALKKEPRTYLWDWSRVEDQGQRAENFIASHLLKATHWWTDHGYGQFELFYLRTKEGREVDFLVAKDGQPWFIVEVKSSQNAPLNPSLAWFQKAIGAKHAFQVYIKGDDIVADCFAHTRPIKVPAKTLLQQLV